MVFTPVKCSMWDLSYNSHLHWNYFSRCKPLNVGWASTPPWIVSCIQLCVTFDVTQSWGNRSLLSGSSAFCQRSTVLHRSDGTCEAVVDSILTSLTPQCSDKNIILTFFNHFPLCIMVVTRITPIISSILTPEVQIVTQEVRCSCSARHSGALSCFRCVTLSVFKVTLRLKDWSQCWVCL